VKIKKKNVEYGYVPRLLYFSVLPTTSKGLTIPIPEARTKMNMEVPQKCFRNINIELPLLEPKVVLLLNFTAFIRHLLTNFLGGFCFVTEY
jgi:hypothetical protein